MFAPGNGLDCGLCLSGTTAPGAPSRRGAAATAAARGCTRVPSAVPCTGAFEEVEGARVLLGRLEAMWRIITLNQIHA